MEKLRKIRSVIAETLKITLALTCAIVGIVMIGCATVEIISGPIPQYQAMEGGLPGFNMNDADSNSKEKREPLIAMYRPDPISGKITFYCTGFVISDKLALTAGHCLKDKQDQRLTKDDIQIKDVVQNDVGIARAGAINTRADMGVVVGDFSSFNKLKLSLSPGGFYFARGPYMACGFPWGAFPGVCLPFQPVSNYLFQIKGTGELYPGMSGGPVIDQYTGLVVAINTAVTDGFVIVAPTVGILGALELEVKMP